MRKFKKSMVFNAVILASAMYGSTANSAAINDTCLTAANCMADLGIIDTTNGDFNQNYSVDEGGVTPGTAASVEVSFEILNSYAPFSVVTIETGSGFQIDDLPTGITATWADSITQATKGQNEEFTIDVSSLVAGIYTFDVTGTAGGGTEANAFNIKFGGTPTEVPIPAAAWLFGSGLIGLAGIARKKKAA